MDLLIESKIIIFSKPENWKDEIFVNIYSSNNKLLPYRMLKINGEENKYWLPVYDENNKFIMITDGVKERPTKKGNKIKFISNAFYEVTSNSLKTIPFKEADEIYSISGKKNKNTLDYILNRLDKNEQLLKMLLVDKILNDVEEE